MEIGIMKDGIFMIRWANVSCEKNNMHESNQNNHN